MKKKEKKKVYLVWDAKLEAKGYLGEDVEAVPFLVLVSSNRSLCNRKLKELKSKDRLMKKVEKLNAEERFEWDQGDVEIYMNYLLDEIRIETWDCNTGERI